MSHKHMIICDICGKEIKDTDCYYSVTRYPSLVDNRYKTTTLTDICCNCITKFNGFMAFNKTEINCEEEQRSAE